MTLIMLIQKKRSSFTKIENDKNDAFNILSESANELNSFNSVIIVFLVTSRTITLIFSVYVTCFYFIYNTFDRVQFSAALTIFLYDLVFFGVIFNAADSPVHEV